MAYSMSMRDVMKYCSKGTASKKLTKGTLVKKIGTKTKKKGVI